MSREKVIQALKKRLEQKEAKPKGATETVLGRSGNGENEEIDFELIEIVKEVPGEERIKTSVQATIDRLLSRLATIIY